ncbi:M28 family peptidase [Alistipes sp. ZOR0009]|uniref:M28 family peptidase n=1 Tax=Alistipes sp. ZOR0009 TaxID=1339253 RepID=UPI00068A5DCC|nr:M28 family peptidase [Alistipes sp. ZOR0009]
MIKKASLLVYLLSFSALTFSQSIPYKQKASAESLKRDLTFLSSDSLKGRATGSKEQEVAASYIANKFKEHGLKGVSNEKENPYFESFYLASSTFPSNHQLTIKESGEALSPLKDIIIATGKSITDSPIIPFIGASDSLKGKLYTKVIVATSFEEGILEIEKQLATNSSISSYMLVLPIKKMVEYNKARLNLTAAKVTFTNTPGDTITLGRNGEKIPFSSNIYFSNVLKFISTHPSITLSITDSFLLKKLFASNTLDNLSNTSKAIIGNTILVNGTISPEKVTFKKVANVVAKLEGTDPNGEAIVVSAHFDHIGVKPVAQKENANADSVCNGADDNGSGTSAIMEISRLFAKAKSKGIQPKRSILFAAFTGEEMGLLGSQYMAQNPFFPLSKIKAVVNLDMVGRTDESHSDSDMYAYPLTFGDTLTLQKVLNRSAKRAKIDIWKEIAPFEMLLWSGGSDHASFVNKDISAIVITTGMHDDYHTPADEVQKINFKRLERISTFTYFTVWELANQ